MTVQTSNTAKTASNTAPLNGSICPRLGLKSTTTKGERPTPTASQRKWPIGSNRLKPFTTEASRERSKSSSTTSKRNSVNPTSAAVRLTPKTSGERPYWSAQKSSSTPMEPGNTRPKTSGKASQTSCSIKFCTAAIGKRRCVRPRPASPSPNGSRKACTAMLLSRGQLKRASTYGTPHVAGTSCTPTAPQGASPVG